MTKRLITPEYAQQLIDECKHDKALMDTLMRPIRPHHVNYLARQMERKAFGNNIIDIAHCKETGQRFIVNGNHTLKAITQSRVQLHLTVEHTTCETIDDVRMAYSRYDRGLNRSRRDSMRSFNAPHETGIPLSHIGYLAAATAFILDDYKLGGKERKSAMIGDDELYDEAATWVEEFKLIRDVVGGAKQWEQRIIRRRGVLSVALVSARANREKAASFWRGVVTGADIPENSPILKLRDYLTEISVTGSGPSTRIPTPADDIAKTVSYCWDKYVRNQPVRSLRVPQGPVVIQFAAA